MENNNFINFNQQQKNVTHSIQGLKLTNIYENCINKLDKLKYNLKYNCELYFFT